MKKFYITTPIYYINAAPHIGHAYSTVSADILARYHRMRGDKTFFLTGTDEHGEKNLIIAEKEKINPQEYADKVSLLFKDAWQKLNISNDNFIRTTDEKHILAVQKALQYLYDKGYIYKGEHSGLYCSGCEQYKTEKDLVNGLCPDHKIKPTMVSEESYMFKLSEFSGQIKEAIEKDELLILPRSKKKEILSFLKNGLKDISFSRKIDWGIKLPWDNSQVAYVWPDAFLNYLTGLGWDGTAGKTPEMWPADVHLMSKDILRVHATIWPAMLLALKLPLPKKLFIHGFFLVDGQKMSKSIGNVIAPNDLMNRYGVDATRFLLASATPFGHDGDIGIEKFDEKYNADLANGLGNLISRSFSLYEQMKKAGIELQKTGGEAENYKGHVFSHISIENAWKSYGDSLNDLKIDRSLALLFGSDSENRGLGVVNFLDNYITSTKPWELIKEKDEKVGKIMYNILERIRHGAWMIYPFMPEIAEIILDSLGFDLKKELKSNFQDREKWGILSEKAKIKKPKILFPRINS